MRAALALVAALIACDRSPSAAPAPAPAPPTAADYADPARCAACHPAEAARWAGSHHRRAMQVATEATVLGDFGGVSVDGRQLVRDGAGFAFDDTDRRRHRVRYAFGVAPLQQYLVEAPGGRLQVMPLAWDTARRTWFQIPGDDLAWTSRYHTWNTMCADCHSTGVRKAYDAAAGTFATTSAEVTVGCQACHGPGARHAADPRERLAVRGDTLACAPCHARRSAIAGGSSDGDLFERYRPTTLVPGLYFPDGQIRDEVFEYGAFAQSAMHEAGVRCVDCHEPHAASVDPSNATCTRCHRAPPPAQFPGLARRATDVDTPAHHHHRPGSPGAACVACHMPARTYMGIDRRRDHGFRVPRPDVAAALGTPDACTSACHTDRGAAWSAAIVAGWFPHDRPRHFGEAFARAAAGGDAGSELAGIATDRARPAIVRATAFELLASDPRACLAAAVGERADPSPLVRSTAIACAEALPAGERARFAGGALRDRARLVRIEAARVLAGPAADALAIADRAAFAAARLELEDACRADLDRPEGWFNLALLAEAEQRRTDAIALYRKALALDPEFAPARANLALLAP
jgi:hypothetical protein